MCGILLVKSRSNIPLEKHLSSFVKLQSRGPDFCRYQYKNNTFIGHAVLHITGTNDYYHTQHQHFLAYNGEIYNYKKFGPWNTDTAFVHHAVEHDLDLLKEAWGPWAWVWTNSDTVRYATDPQGERALYQYQDDDILIVCSEVAPMLDYIKTFKIPSTYSTKHWVMLKQTPWHGIKKINPGQLYENGQPVGVIDSIWSWLNLSTIQTLDEAYEEFKSKWSHTIDLMKPSCQAALTCSGGMDSGIILSHIQDLELYTTNMLGKDPIAEHIKDFLNEQEQNRHNMLNVDPASWAMAYKQILQHTQMPVQSWSFVGHWIINQHCDQRVIFTGAGADELFGGYDIYQNLNFVTDRSVSPYSENGDSVLWQQCLSAYNGHAGQATLLMDYWYQIVGCDARGIDVTAGAWGIEARNPFLAKPIMQFALNLPFEFKVGAVPKPLIRKLWLERWSQHDIMPKKGFTGHCNDALPWLGIQIETNGDRSHDWQQIVTKSFFTAAN